MNEVLWSARTGADRTAPQRRRILALRGQARRQNLSAAITFNTKDRNLRIVTLHEDRNGGQLRARVKGSKPPVSARRWPN